MERVAKAFVGTDTIGVVCVPRASSQSGKFQ
jgi:hypothetical protein